MEPQGAGPCSGRVNRLFKAALDMRALPLPIRWTGTVALVLLAFWVHHQAFRNEAVPPYLLPLVAVIVSAAFFDQGSSIIAAVLSTFLAAYFLIPPAGSLAIIHGDDAVALWLYFGVSLALAALVEALHRVYVEAEEAHRAAVSARQRAEASERSHDLLLSEFRHRVKNDLQRVVTLLTMQAGAAPPEAAAALRAGAERVHVIARVHDRLSHRDGLVMVEMGTFLRDLIADLRVSVAGLRPIGLFVEAEDDTLLTVARAGAVGLIVNELVTNALKHAFPGERMGSIRVGFRREEGRQMFVLTVADDGVGMATEAGTEAAAPRDARGRPERLRTEGQGGGVGLRLVRALAAQLGGRVETVPHAPPDSGTVHVLRFPVRAPGEAAV